jgi:hypothetical protein
VIGKAEKTQTKKVTLSFNILSEPDLSLQSIGNIDRVKQLVQCAQVRR